MELAVQAKWMEQAQQRNVFMEKDPSYPEEIEEYVSTLLDKIDMSTEDISESLRLRSSTIRTRILSEGQFSRKEVSPSSRF